jgi:hypothetical protein
VVVDFPARPSVAVLQAMGRRCLHAAGMRTEAYQVFSLREVAGAFEQNGFRVFAVHRQFVLPIALHKALGSRRLTTAVERLLARWGLLGRLGSPVTVVAERCETS